MLYDIKFKANDLTSYRSWIKVVTITIFQLNTIRLALQPSNVWILLEQVEQ